MYVLAILTALVVLSTIAAGAILLFRRLKGGIKRGKTFVKMSLTIFVSLLTASLILTVPEAAHAANDTSSNAGLGLIAVALSTGLAALGAGIAVGSVGSSALGAVTEDPGMLGRTLIFIGLAEGIAIYGLVISIIILGRI